MRFSLPLICGFLLVTFASAQEKAEAPPWQVNAPIISVKKVLYKKHATPRAAALATVQYVGPKLEMREWQGVETNDDVHDNQVARWSMDNGRTWSKLVNVFLLAGQSNMAGADSYIIDPPGFVPTEADRKTLFTCAPLPEGTKSRAYALWGEIRGHRGKGDKLSHGPEVGFVRGLYEKGWRNLAVIKVWANFPRDARTWPWAEGGDLYKPWCAFVDERLRELKERGYECRVVGFVWHQGIDDAIHPTLSATYESNLGALIGALRKRYADEKTPFVLARSVNSPIARRATGGGERDPMAVVRRAQLAVAQSVPRCAWIDVDDLPNVVEHHFSAASQLIIGRRFAEKYVALVGQR
jgi:hypothetical protein